MIEEIFNVKDKVVLVTGGSKGIGRMIAEVFVKSGSKVYITARHGDVVAKTSEELSEYGYCVGIQNDLSSMEGVDHLVREINSYESHLDVLINNAATGWHEEFESFPEKGWDKTFNLNLKSVFFLIQKLVPLMEANATKDDPSKVINIASIDGVGIADYDSYPYTASKAGLIHLTRSLGKVLVEKNIYVNGIAPGAFPTDMNEMARDNPQVLGAFVPNYRVGNKEDIGGSCIYLASKASNYVIGETIVVDGGWTSVAYGGMMSRHLKEEI